MSERMPPVDPQTEEASPEQLDAARAQGEAYGSALKLMTEKVAEGGGEQRAGEYLVGYALEKAEGMYEPLDGDLEWREPEGDNCHIEVSVRDAGDGRFVPGLTVQVTVVDGDGNEVGTHEHPMLWHPMLYHYGRNWTVPGDGTYTLRVRIDPAPFPRHDRVNGKRYAERVECEFRDVRITTGAK